MKKTLGFTLIELVVVIVILGVLAVVAAPRFLNLSSDARTATMLGLKGALIDASDLVYSKAVIEGKETLAYFDQEPGPEVEGVLISFGYPRAQEIEELLGLSEDDWTFLSNESYARIAPAEFKDGDSQLQDDAELGCNILYQEASVRAPHQTKIQVYLGGC